MSEVRYQDTFKSSRKDSKLAYSEDIYDKPSGESVESRLNGLSFGYEVKGDYDNKVVARNSIPANYRKAGLMITYRYNGKYVSEQFDGDDVSEWDNDNYWKPTTMTGLTSDIYDKESQKSQKEINKELEQKVNEALSHVQTDKDTVKLGFDEDTGEVYADVTADSNVKSAEQDEDGNVSLNA